jgi:hypothetical protein
MQPRFIRAMEAKASPLHQRQYRPELPLKAVPFTCAEAVTVEKTGRMTIGEG